MRDSRRARLALESGRKFGARVTSYRSMWTMYRIN